MEIINCGSIFGKKKQKSYVNIPADVVHDILLRSPAKSLLRFRCVSKMCCNIIDSVSFANMHELAGVEECQILYTPRLLNFVKKLHSIAYDETNHVMKKSETSILEFLDGKHDYQLRHVAYGLLMCIRDGRCHGQLDLVFLLNPLREEVLELPKQTEGVSKNNNRMRRPMWYGMGFDCTTNTYKVVRVFGIAQVRFETEVYTLGTNSWRKISSNPSCMLSVNGVTAYGDMHWVRGVFEKGKQYEMIITFDFKKEEFKWTRHPNLGYNNSICCRNFSLISIGGSLAIVNIPSNRHIDIWLLKDYEKKDYYWVREFRLNTDIKMAKDISPWHSKEIFGAWGTRGLFLGTFSCEYYVIDLKTSCISQCILQEAYNNDDVESIIILGRVYNYTRSIICLRNFGNFVANHDGYKILKTIRHVYTMIGPQSNINQASTSHLKGPFKERFL